MFEPLGTPAFLVEARRIPSRNSPVTNVLIFFVLTFVAEVLSNLIVLPYEMFYLFRDGMFSEIAAIEDPTAQLEALMALAESLMKEPLFLLLSLFSSAATIAVVLIYVRCMEKRSYFSLGLTKKPYGEYALGFGIGILLIALAIGFSLVFGSLSFAGISANIRFGYILPFLLAFAVQGFSEELLFRGFLMSALGRGLPLWMAVLTSAFAFTALHISGTDVNVIGFINLFLFGVLMALYMIRRGSLWGAAAIHTAWSFAEGILTDGYVGGVKMPTSILVFAEKEGDYLIHGGSFGLEGGIAASFVLVLAIAILLMMKTKNAQDPMLHIPTGDN